MHKPFTNHISYPSAGGWTIQEVMDRTGYDKPTVSKLKAQLGFVDGLDYYYVVKDGLLRIMFSDQAIARMKSEGPTIKRRVKK